MLNKIKNLFRGNANSLPVKREMNEEGQLYTQVTSKSFTYRENDIVYQSCIKILANAISSINFALYKDNEKVANNFYRVLSVKPNLWQNAAEFWYHMETMRNKKGNAYAYIQHDRMGNLDSLIPLDPSNMRVYINNTEEFMNAKIIYEYLDSERGKTYTLLPDEILHFKANSLNGILGVAGYDVLYESLRSNNVINGYMEEIANNGFSGVMTLTYTSDLSVEKRKKLLEQVKEILNSQGSRMLAIPAGIEAKVIGPSNIDSSYVNLLDKNNRKIAGFMGIPLFMLGEEGSSGTSALTSAQAAAFYSATLKPIIKQYCNELTSKLLTNKQINEHYYFDDEDIAGFNYLSSNERTDNYAKLVAAGILTVNEVRAELGFTRYEDDINSGDLLYRNGAFTSADNGDSIGSKDEKITVDHSAVAE